MSDFGDISYRIGTFASAQLLTEAKQLLILPRWAQQRPQPMHKGLTQNFRRYKNLGTILNPIHKANTPTGSELEYEDFTMNLKEYGSWTPVDRYIRDTLEDNVLQEAIRVNAYQMAKSLETLTYNVVKGGTSKVYTNGAARSSVNTVLSRKAIVAAVRQLENNDAREVTSLVRSTPDFNTTGIEQSFFGYCHTDLSPTLRKLDGFLRVNEYSSRITPLPGEIGTLEKVRFVASNIAEPWVAGGATGGTNVIEDAATGKANVYPVMIFGQEAFATSTLAGQGAAKVVVHNPMISDSDKLGQRGHVAWCTWYSSVILNNNYMTRIECAAQADAGLS